MVTLKSFDGGEFDAYMALPASGYGPGIVVLQEIFGVNEYMRTVCDCYASHGFVAICPDLFWRQEPGIQLTDRSEAEWQKAFALIKGSTRRKQSRTPRRRLNFCGNIPRATEELAPLASV